MIIAIELPKRISVIIAEVHSGYYDEDYIYSIIGLLLFDYYFVKAQESTPQLTLLGPAHSINHADIAGELFDLNLNDSQDLTRDKFIKMACDFYTAALPYTDPLVQKYSHMSLQKVSFDDRFDEHQGTFRSYAFFEFQ